MGVLAKEKKLRRWMVRHNRTGKELLDPTNRVPVHPSEVAVVKPPAFGLGRADAYSLDLVRNKFGRNVQLVDSLLPRRFQDEKDVEDLPDDPASGKAGQLGRTASRTSFKIKPDQAEDPYSSLAQTDFAPLWDERLEGDSRVAYRPLLSKAELQKLERLKREHKESVNTGGRKPGETTIVMGREFKGAGFLLTPKEVVFKDFEVGEKYRHKITLTNVFWTKNTFKVMEMPPEVRGLDGAKSRSRMRCGFDPGFSLCVFLHLSRPVVS